MGLKIPVYLTSLRRDYFRLLHWTRFHIFVPVALMCLVAHWAGSSPELHSFRNGVIIAIVSLVAFPLALGTGGASATILARERKEGTLPLLFMTGLNPMQVLLSRGLLRMGIIFSYVIACIPFLIPVYGATPVDLFRLSIYLVGMLGAIYGCIGTCLALASHHGKLPTGFFLMLPLLAIPPVYSCFATGSLNVVENVRHLGWMIRSYFTQDRAHLGDAILVVCYFWIVALVGFSIVHHLLKRNWSRPSSQTRGNESREEPTPGKRLPALPVRLWRSLCDRFLKRRENMPLGELSPFAWLSKTHFGRWSKWGHAVLPAILLVVSIYFAFFEQHRPEDFHEALLATSIMGQWTLLVGTAIGIGMILNEMKRTGLLELVVKGTMKDETEFTSGLADAIPRSLWQQPRRGRHYFKRIFPSRCRILSREKAIGCVG